MVPQYWWQYTRIWPIFGNRAQHRSVKAVDVKQLLQLRTYSQPNKAQGLLEFVKLPFFLLNLCAPLYSRLHWQICLVLQHLSTHTLEAVVVELAKFCPFQKVKEEKIDTEKDRAHAIGQLRQRSIDRSSYLLQDFFLPSGLNALLRKYSKCVYGLLVMRSRRRERECQPTQARSTLPNDKSLNEKKKTDQRNQILLEYMVS